MSEIPSNNSDHWYSAGRDLAAIGTFLAGAIAVLWRVGMRNAWNYLLALVRMPIVVSNSFAVVSKISNDTAVNGAIVQVLLHHFGKPVWRSAPDGQVTWCNDVTTRLLGISASDLEGDAWRSIVAEHDRERVFREWNACVTQDRKFDMRYEWVNSCGERIPIHAVAHVLRDESGKRVGYLGIVDVLPVTT